MGDIYLYNDEMWRVKYKFNYTGQKEEFRLTSGRYLCICKGGSGGKFNNYFVNKGGCSYGILNLTSPLVAFAVVGGNGGDAVMESPGMGGFNGGGNGGRSSSQGGYLHGAGGGGASDIRLTDQESVDVPVIHQIPEGLDQLEYIQSDGSQYINTNAIHKANTKIEFIGEVITNWALTYEAIFGARGGVIAKALVMFTRFSGSNIPCYASGNTETRGSNFIYDQPVKVVANANVVSWYDSNDELKGSITSATQVDGDKPMFLFDLNNVGSSEGSRARAKLSSFKMWNGDTLVRYMIPYKDNETGEVGLYDLVNNTKYTKATGNNFTAGPVVENKTEYEGVVTVPVGLLSRIMVAGGGGGQGLQNGGDPTDYADFTGYGGGVNGGYPYTKNDYPNNHKASTQTSGYSFGTGQSGINRDSASRGSSYSLEGIAGAGGGWYGGFTSNVSSVYSEYSCANAGGGSGYILTEDSYKPERYMYNINPREDLNFSDTLMTAGLANESCVIICEPVKGYYAGDRLICDCIGNSTSFPLYGGKYHIRCSGGQGAHRIKSRYARKGGYAEGVLENPYITTAYAYVGGSSLLATGSKGADFIQSTHPTASFNGGGKPPGYGSVMETATGAGGGTDLRIGTDSLLARVIVAGGAGGNGRFDSYGGAGGGLSGDIGANNKYGTNYGAGTQNKAGAGDIAAISGGFGYGGSGRFVNGGYGGAGGGGWYGGSGTEPDSSADDDNGGSGGSGYVLTSESYKPPGYLLGEEYYLTDTVLTTGGQDQLFPAPITGLVIDVIYSSVCQMLAHDEEGYKYYDEENKTWTFLKIEDPTLEDFDEYGVYSFDNDTGLKDVYDIYIYDEYNSSNRMVFNVLPPPGNIKFRYRTEHTLARYNVDSDIDESAIDMDIDIKRKGVAEDAYLYFDFKYDLHDVPDKTVRVYSIQGFTQGASLEYHERKKKEKTLEHIDLLPVGSSTRMPARFKNYIGSFINGTEAITTINSAVVCEHNRCIYSATLCNDSVVRFAKLNLVNNTSTIIKDIPKSQIGNAYYGDIKVDDDYIYLTSSSNDNSYNLWRTPNSSDPTVNTYSVTNSDIYRIQAVGKMEWYDDHTLMIMMRKGLAFFDTKVRRFTYKMFPDGTQNNSRRDYAMGKKKIISLYNGTSKSAYVIDIETGACESLDTVYGQTWAGEYINYACYHDGTFYVVQRNRLHYLDEETMNITFSIPTPFTDVDPKQIVYGNGILYIIIQNKPSLYMYDISTQTFYAAGIPFSIDNWASNGWIRMCAFRGYCFIPQIRLYTINFVDRAKYNMGYKYDQFVIVMNKETSETEDDQFEYDDKYVTFTKDNMQIHAGDIHVDMIDVDPINQIKMITMSKDQYNKILKTSLTKVEDAESEGT